MFNVTALTITCKYNTLLHHCVLSLSLSLSLSQYKIPVHVSLTCPILKRTCILCQKNPIVTFDRGVTVAAAAAAAAGAAAAAAAAQAAKAAAQAAQAASAIAVAAATTANY